MDEYPSNSHKAREAEPEAEQPKIDQVTQGEAIRRKKPLGKRFAETFVGGDAKSVWDYVVWDVLVPAAKDMTSDAVSQGIERMLFGEVRSGGRRGRSSSSAPGHVSYNRMYTSNGGRKDRDSERPRTRRDSQNFDEIIVATRVEGEEVVDRLFELIQRYEVASVADFYEMVGVTGNYIDGKWGWTDIRGTQVVKVRDGYLIDLPRPVALDER